MWSSEQPTIGQAVGYGFLSVSLINLSAIVGFMFVFCKQYKLYSNLLSFMVATAVGSLVSSSLVVLLPEAFMLINIDSLNNSSSANWYIPRSIAAVVGFLLFYILEFFLHRIPYFIECRKRHNEAKTCVESTLSPGSMHSSANHHIECTMNNYIPVNGVKCDEDVYSTVAKPDMTIDDSNMKLCDLNSVQCTGDKSMSCDAGHRKTFCNRVRNMEAVGWMILIGDAVHNFMDGLSIGAGFSQSFRLGIFLSITVLCEEFPHELGDFAVLLRSGLNIWSAVICNFISACTAYLGLFVGVYFGELGNFAAYVFAITAGFFLYISLADMLPEMRAMEDVAAREHRNIWTPFFINLFGMTFGFACIITITLVSANVQ